jgi:hypothetical protein
VRLFPQLKDARPSTQVRWCDHAHRPGGDVALLAMALAQSAVVKTNGLIEVIYYIVAGLGWVLPAMPLIRWMSRPDSV